MSDEKMLEMICIVESDGCNFQDTLPAVGKITGSATSSHPSWEKEMNRLAACLLVWVMLTVLNVSPILADERLDSATKKVQSLVDNGKWLDVVKEIDAFLAEVAKDKKIRFDDELAPFYAARGHCHGRLKNYNQAVADYTKAAEMAPKYAWHPLSASLILSTCSDEKVRDGKIAIKFALQGQKLMNERNPTNQFLAYHLVDCVFMPPLTLAAAYAEAGQFKDAAKTLKDFIDEFNKDFTGIELLALGVDKVKTRMELTKELLDQYRDSKPWRIKDQRGRKRDLGDLADLGDIHFLYKVFHEDRGRGPHNAKELLGYRDYPKSVTPIGIEILVRAKKAIQSEDYIIIWEVDLSNKDGNSGKVLAYTKDVPEMGGAVCYQDGAREVLTLEDFKQKPMPNLWQSQRSDRGGVRVRRLLDK